MYYFDIPFSTEKRVIKWKEMLFTLFACLFKKMSLDVKILEEKEVIISKNELLVVILTSCETFRGQKIEFFLT